ncbi:hypothetical protein PF005_g5186 [Phytophthora fragariae]|uniref:Uncharacterized protein n=1 Tax=Phytophthora fragariae TaxID=53985 RepID=A0A6A3YWE6_9STRA|nr:hypothetical protein PF005_g5186 [Phytophthora fragariae]
MQPPNAVKAQAVGASVHITRRSEENQGVVVVAPPLQKTQFESWADLQDYLEVYEREHVPDHCMR